MSAAYRCEFCGEWPEWQALRIGDAVVSWACEAHTAWMLDGLQRDNERTKLIVTRCQHRGDYERLATEVAPEPQRAEVQRETPALTHEFVHRATDELCDYAYPDEDGFETGDYCNEVREHRFHGQVQRETCLNCGNEHIVGRPCLEDLLAGTEFEVQRETPCPKCGAAPGEPCTTGGYLPVGDLPGDARPEGPHKQRQVWRETDACVRCGGEGPFNSQGWCQGCASPGYT